MKKIFLAVALVFVTYASAQATDVTWDDKVANDNTAPLEATEQFSAADANEVKTAVNSKANLSRVTWVTGTAYTADNTMVAHGGHVFVCTSSHTSSAAGGTGDEPGVGDTWQTKWKYHGADLYAAALTSDQNYVSDAQLVVIGNTSGTNTGDQTNVSGTAGGLSGTPNITVGTVSAGTGGFTVDADGDVTAKSVNITKVSGTAGDLGLSEANSTDTHGAGWRGPASITGDEAYRGQFANAGPTEAAIQVWGAQTAGTGTAADPYIHAIPFITLGPLFQVSGSALGFTSSAVPNMGGISFGADPAINAGGGPRLGNNMAIYWKAASGDNIPIAVDSSDIIQMGQNADGINLNSSPVSGMSMDTGGTGNAITVPLNGLLDNSITTPADADDMIYVRSQKAITITDIYCVAQGGGTITLTLQECDNATCASPSTIEGAITCDADGAEDDGTLTDGSGAAGAWYKVLFSAPTGTVTSLAWSVDGVQTW